MTDWRQITISCFAMLATNSSLQAAGRPNIVFIYTNDQAAWALGHVGNEQAQSLDVQTPNLDRLCRERACFSNAFGGKSPDILYVTTATTCLSEVALQPQGSRHENP